MENERTCKRCNERPAANKTGKPRCSQCRKEMIELHRVSRLAPVRNCPSCGKPMILTNGKRGRPSCDDCSVMRHDWERTCLECGKEYRSRGGNKRCPMCKYYEMKKPCPSCGVLIHPKSKTCLKCSAIVRRGADHPAWRGGKTMINGYVLTSAPDHPRVRSGYVLEHIIVMEKKLGRYLLSGENIHHLNGVKNDNRLENLELWVKSQPAGQRVEDLVKWAHGIIDRYGV